MTNENPFLLAAEKIKAIAIEAVKIEYSAQGHRLTGALIDSIEGQVKEVVNGAKIEGILLDYGVPVNTGVPRERVPYNPNRRSGAKVSKYIAGLQLFAELRFRVSKKEALGIAFAIARKHKKEGIPTRASRKFSRTGKRTGAIQEGLKKVDPEMQKIIEEIVTKYVNTLIVTVFKKNIPKVKVSR
jgi:hypothetical protein